MRRSLLLGVGIAALSLAACGGGGGSSSLPSITPNNGGSSSPSSGQRASASVTIAIPARASASDVRSPRYISASTQSMTFATVDGTGKATQIASFDLTPTSPGCSAVAGGGTQCAETLGAPSGQSTFQVVAYDQTGAKGNQLSTATIGATLTAGAANTIPLVMNGVAKTVGVVLGTTQFQAGSPGSVIAAVQAGDAAGNLIVGPGAFAAPITLAITSGDAYKALSFSQATITNPGQLVTLNYNGKSLTTATITASGSGVTAGTTTVAALGSRAISHPLPEYMRGVQHVAVASDGTVWFNWNNNSSTHLATNADGSYLNGGIGKMTADGTVTAYAGDRPAPGATPYVAPPATPAPPVPPLPVGATPAPTPYPVASGSYSAGHPTIVANLPTLGFLTPDRMYSDYSLAAFDTGHAAGDANVYYGDVTFGNVVPSTMDPNAISFQEQGELIALNGSSLTATIANVQGKITAVHAGTDGSTWFVEQPAQQCSPYFPNPMYDPTWYWYNCNTANNTWYLGRRDASGTVTEWPLSTLGFQPSPSIFEFTIAPDNSALYLADCGQTSAVEMVPISGGVPQAIKIVTKMTNGCPVSTAVGSDGNVYFSEGHVLTGGFSSGKRAPMRTFGSNGSYYVGRISGGAGFSDANAIDWPIPVLGTYPGFMTAMPDGVWFSDYDDTASGRISNLSATVPTITDYPLVPAGVLGSNSCGIAGDTVNGIVYEANCNQQPGSIIGLVYGGVSNGTTVNGVRRSGR